MSSEAFRMPRRGALICLTAAIAAPFVIRTAGILMPVRKRLLLNLREIALLKEVQEWRQSTARCAESRICVNWTGEGWTHIDRLAEAERRFRAMGLV